MTASEFHSLITIWLVIKIEKKAKLLSPHIDVIFFCLVCGKDHLHLETNRHCSECKVERGFSVASVPAGSIISRREHDWYIDKERLAQIAADRLIIEAKEAAQQLKLRKKQNRRIEKEAQFTLPIEEK